MTKELASRVIGKVTLGGTDWPRVESLLRHQYPGHGPYWQVAVVCGGVCERAHEFLRLRDARAAFEAAQ